VSETRTVTNPTQASVYVSGFGPLAPDETADVPASDEVKELVAIGALTAAKSRKSDKQQEE
jgi:hypothetical protein